jgi:hypothetical protein
MRTVTVTVLLVAVLGGCGGKSKNEANDYAVQVQRVQFRFANDFDKATQQLLKSTDPKTDAKALNDAAFAVTLNATALKTIPPPKEVRGLHRQLITAVTGYAATLRHAAKLVRDGNPQDFLHAKALLTKASSKITSRFNSIINQINLQLG